MQDDCAITIMDIAKLLNGCVFLLREDTVYADCARSMRCISMGSMSAPTKACEDEALI